MSDVFVRPHSARAAALVAAAFGFFYFVWIAGVHVLNVTNIEWLLRHDWSQHYLAWAFFRATQAPVWQWPFGSIPEVLEPSGTTLALMDGNPLVSFVLGSVSAVLPTRFQFLGWYLACNFALQGAFGARLMARLGSTFGVQALGGMFFVLAPILLHRVPHDTLTPQWLLLWAIGTYFPGQSRPQARMADGRHLVWILLLGAVTHAYLLAMLLPLAWGSVLARARRASWRESVPLFFGALIGSAGAGSILWGLGLLAESKHKSLGFGFFSANLITLFDPGTWSRWLPAWLPVHSGQRFEGFGYLGMGGLVLVALACGGMLRGAAPGNRPDDATVKTQAPALGPTRKEQAANGVWELCAVALVCFVYALSDHMYFGTKLVWNASAWYDAIGGPIRLFRSSGRFVWPLVYTALTLCLYRLQRRAGGIRMALMLSVASVLQYVEVNADSQHAQFVAPSVRPVRDPVWADAWPEYKHIALLPPWFPGSDVHCGFAYPDKYEVPLLLFAAEQGMGVNCAYLSHYDRDQLLRICRREQKVFLEGQFRADTLYVLPSELVQRNHLSAHGLTCGLADDYVLCAKQTERPTALVRRLAAQHRAD